MRGARRRMGQREGQLIKGILTAAVSRGSAALAPFALIFILLPAMGEYTFGAWLTVTSLTGMMVWADLGLGNGLLTQLSRSLEQGHHAQARREISTAYTLVAGMAVVLFTGVWMSTTLFSWNVLLGLPKNMQAEATTLALVSLGVFACNVPLSLIQRIQYAAEQVSRNNLITAVGPLLSLTLASVATATSAALWLLVLAAASGPILANIFATATFFRSNPHLCPTVSAFQRAQAGPLLRLGMGFLVITTMSAIAYNLDNLVIAQVGGASAVTDFGVTARVFAVLGLLVAVVNQPLWPMNARALAAKDFEWVARNTRRMISLSTGAVFIASILIAASAEPLLNALTRGRQEPNYALLATLALWWVLVSATSPLSMVQNAAGRLGPQLIGWTLFLVLSIPCKIFAAGHLGLHWVPLMGALAYSVTVLPALVHGYKAVMK